MALTPEQQLLFDGNLERVKREAKHLARRIGADQDEALSACLRSFVFVVQRFDPSRGFMLTTLLWPSLYHAVEKAKRSDRVIHIPGSYFDGTMRADHAAKVPRVMHLPRVKADQEAYMPLVDPSAPDPIREAVKAEELANLDRLLSLLPWQHRVILRARARSIRLRTLAYSFDMTFQRVHQIEQEAMATMQRLASFRNRGQVR